MPSKRPQEKQSSASRLISIVEGRFDLYRDAVRKDVFAVPKAPPYVATKLRGRSQSVRSAMVMTYRHKYGTPPAETAIRQALDTIEAMADGASEVVTHLRSAQVMNALYIDMGDGTGRQIVIQDGKWSIQEADGGVFFRRTALIGPMPEPVRGGDLNRIQREFHLSDDQWDLVRSWLVLTWLTNIPVPILTLLGPNGAGKTYLAKMLVNLTDPGVLVGTKPRDFRNWVLRANNQRVIGIDNLGSMPDWLEDPICACVTGEELVERELYTDEDVKLYVFKRALVITSIDPGALRPDIADRLMAVEMESLVGWRRSEEELNRIMVSLTPGMLGGLLDLVAEVLRLGQQPVTNSPRMVDAAEFMAAVDAVTGGESVAAYRAAREQTAQIVIESDPVGEALIALLRAFKGDTWEGTATELHTDLTAGLSNGTPEGWPKTARLLSKQLNDMRQSLDDNQVMKLGRGRRGNDKTIILEPLGKL